MSHYTRPLRKNTEFVVFMKKSQTTEIHAV